MVYNMEYDVKKEARKQYLNYFKVWFILAGVLLAIAIVLGVKNSAQETVERTNNQAPAQRVYDEADVLTSQQEADLETYIAEAERRCHCDIVLVTISKPVEGPEIQDMGYRYDNWDYNMRDLADDFYDNNKFGYNKDFEGDGVLLLDNWYEGQAGSWLSTSGKVYEEMGTIEIDELLDDVYYYVEDNPYKAYKAYVDYIVDLMQPVNNGVILLMVAPVCLLIALIVALIFVVSKLRNKEGKVTVVPSTYTDGNAVYNVRDDRFIRKHVSTRRIQTSSSSGGGGGGSHSRGGSHRSSSGARHGGGGRRR